jgi:hypothetical protein
VTLTRLHEHQAKRGVAREKHFVESQRRIVNQHRAEGYSNRRSELLWTVEFHGQSGLSGD